jgi:serine/threonine protein kinase
MDTQIMESEVEKELSPSHMFLRHDEHPAENNAPLDLAKWSNLSGQSGGKPQSFQDRTGPLAMSMTDLVYNAFMYDTPVCDYADIRFSKVIGFGACMVVYEGTFKSRSVALKQLRSIAPRNAGKDNLLTRLPTIDLELRVTSDTFLKSQENIVELIGFSWTLDDTGGLRPILIMELACPDHPTLKDLIDKVNVTNFQIKGSMISDIIHGDLKPENVLIFSHDSPGFSRHPVAKVSDFGFCEDSAVSVATSPAAGGTEYWNAPECLPQADPELATFRRRTGRDMYSFGLVSWYIIRSALPLGPDHGHHWEDNRETAAALKLNGAVPSTFLHWIQNCLEIVPLEDISDDVSELRQQLDDPIPEINFSAHSAVKNMKSDEGYLSLRVSDELLFRNEGKVKLPWPIQSLKANRFGRSLGA